MKLSFLFFGNKPDEKWALARQMGVGYAIAKLASELTGDLPPWDNASLKKSRDTFENNGFKLIAVLRIIRPDTVRFKVMKYISATAAGFLALLERRMAL